MGEMPRVGRVRCRQNCQVDYGIIVATVDYSRLSHNAYGRAGRKVMQFRGYAGLELERIM